MKLYLVYFLSILASASVVSVAVSQECEFKRPSDSIFDIVDDSGTKFGTAVLIDTQQGLFLTALHFLGSSKLKLKRDNQEWKFTRVMSGQNSANLYEDWAIITIGTDAALYEGIHLIYDMPSPEALRKSAVYNSAQSVGNVGSVKWNETVQDGMACTGSGVSLLRLSDYDKGDSGSPIFSSDECGVVGLTSRFILAENATDAQEKEVVELFEKFSENLPEADEKRISDQASLEGKIVVVRELLKNEMYVKMVPTKCVLDEVVEETFFRKNEKGMQALEAAVRDEVRTTLNYMTSIDLNDSANITRFATKAFKYGLRWPEIVAMWNRYNRAKIEHTLKEGRLSSSLWLALGNISSKRKFSYIYTPYDRGMKEIASAPPTSDTYINGGLDFSQFIEQNAKWDGDSDASPLSGLSIGTPAPMSVGPASQHIIAGLEMLNELKKLSPEDRENEDLVNFYKDASTKLLTEGLSGTQPPNPEVVDPEGLSGKALVGLAELVYQLSPTEQPTTGIRKRDLARNLASVGRTQLKPTDFEFVVRAHDIVGPVPEIAGGRERFRLEDLQILVPNENRVFVPMNSGVPPIRSPRQDFRDIGPSFDGNNMQIAPQ